MAHNDACCRASFNDRNERHSLTSVCDCEGGKWVNWMSTRCPIANFFDFEEEEKNGISKNNISILINKWNQLDQLDEYIPV